MNPSETEALMQIQTLLASGDRAAATTKKIVEIIRSLRGYRWLGLYAVTETEIAVIAWTGTQAPAHLSFPISQGLCGAAVQSRNPVVVGNVQNDPRYLTTFATTRSEIIVPILHATEKVVGVIDAESERPDAFNHEDTAFLQQCAHSLLPIFS